MGCMVYGDVWLYYLPQVLLTACQNSNLRAMSDLECPAIVTAIDRLLQNEPRTSSWLAAVVELCLIMLCARGASVSRPQGWTAAWCPSAAAACLLAAAWSNSYLGAAHRSAADVSVAAGGAASTSSGCSSAGVQRACMASTSCPPAAVAPAERRI